MRSAFLAEYNVTVYEDGRIYSNHSGKFQKHQKDRLGYLKVFATRSSGKRSGLFVHRAIALAFIPNPENKPCVNHINGIKSDFRIENLEWCNHKENTAHAIRTGLFKPGQGEYIDRKKMRNLAVSELSRLGWTHNEIGEAFGFVPVNVCHIKKKTRGINGVAEMRELREMLK